MITTTKLLVSVLMGLGCLSGMTGITCVDAHTKIIYPGQRGDNLAQTDEFPYGMQRVYPCGGLPLGERVPYALPGGALSIAPGYFTGHKVNTMYVNLRLGADPDSPDVESQPLIPEFKIWGPTDQPYPDAFCLTNIGAGTALKEGDKATLQVVQVLKNGGALYNCVDIIIAAPAAVAALTTANCANSTSIHFVDPNSPQMSSSTSTPTGGWDFDSSQTSIRAALFSSTSVASASCGPTASACPAGNGVERRDAGANLRERIGWGIGGLVLGALGL